MRRRYRFERRYRYFEDRNRSPRGPEPDIAADAIYPGKRAPNNLTGGIHTSALCNDEGVIVLGKDIGRHNTLDKIMGECLLRKISTKDKILLTSGRVSSEMMRKAAKMQVPVIASLTSPTRLAVTLAHDLDMTLVGYVRGSQFTVYSRPDRLGSISESEEYRCGKFLPSPSAGE